MTLGYAVIIVAVLFLIDKHNVWKRAGQITLALCALAIVAGGLWLTWQSHVEKQATKTHNAAMVNYCNTHHDLDTTCQAYPVTPATVCQKGNVFDRMACETNLADQQ